MKILLRLLHSSAHMQTDFLFTFYNRGPSLKHAVLHSHYLGGLEIGDGTQEKMQCTYALIEFTDEWKR